MITPRSGHIGLTLPYNGKVLIAGGTSGGAPVTANELYDPVTGTFVANEPMSVARDEFAANFFALPAVGQVLVSGGVDSNGTPLALSETFSYQTIRTDQPDYPPGSPVIIYGAGWTPGETVLIQIQQSNNETEEFSDTADSTGSFTDYNNFEISDTDGGVVFQMTATGQTSRLDRAGSVHGHYQTSHWEQITQTRYRWRHHRQLRRNVDLRQLSTRTATLTTHFAVLARGDREFSAQPRH